jgi:5'-3' exonuclease
MTSPESPLKEYYPSDFDSDANGKQNSWESVVKIPFINESILVSTISKIDHEAELTEGEKGRNIAGQEYRAVPTRLAQSENETVAVKEILPNSGWGSAFESEMRSSWQHKHVTSSSSSHKRRK